jgi:hypothetical protein
MSGNRYNLAGRLQRELGDRPGRVRIPPPCCAEADDGECDQHRQLRIMRERDRLRARQ